MAEVVGATPKGVAIAGWMVQANPAIYDVGTAMVESDADGWEEEWRWSCKPTYRLDIVAKGQPVLLWITRNPNPHLGSGIWLYGHAVGEPYTDSASGSLLWRDRGAQAGAEWFLPMEVAPLKRFIAREQLQAHPVLKDLEVLRCPQMSNPQIITPAQLDALRSDFDLTTAPIEQDLAQQISAFESSRPTLRSGRGDWDQDPAELVLGNVDDSNELTVRQEAGRWVVSDLDGLIDSRSDRWSAFELALQRASAPGEGEDGAAWEENTEIGLLTNGADTWLIAVDPKGRFTAAPDGETTTATFQALGDALKHAADRLFPS